MDDMGIFWKVGMDDMGIFSKAQVGKLKGTHYWSGPRHIDFLYIRVKPDAVTKTSMATL